MKIHKKLYIALAITTLTVSNSGFVYATEETNHFEQPTTTFSRSEIEKWEQSVLEKMNAETPIGDFKEERKGLSPQSAYGGWSWRDGLICITDSYASVPFFNNGHAGIVAAAPYYEATIEANPADGVQPKYGSWAHRFRQGKVYQLGVKRTTVAQDHTAAVWAAKQINKPYSRQWFNIGRRDAYYCSHLVWAAYKDVTGVDIGTWEWGSAIHPFELMNSNETQLTYRNR